MIFRVVKIQLDAVYRIFMVRRRIWTCEYLIHIGESLIIMFALEIVDRDIVHWHFGLRTRTNRVTEGM